MVVEVEDLHGLTAIAAFFSFFLRGHRKDACTATDLILVANIVFQSTQIQLDTQVTYSHMA